MIQESSTGATAATRRPRRSQSPESGSAASAGFVGERPGQAVVAGGVPGVHPIGLVVAAVERMTAGPHLPPVLRRVADHDVLPGRSVVAGQDDGPLSGGQVGGVLRLDRLDPPMLGVQRRAADVEPPALPVGQRHQRGTFQRRALELCAGHRGHRLEVHAVRGAGDHVGETPALGHRPAQPVGQPIGAVVVDRARPAGPESGTRHQEGRSPPCRPHRGVGPAHPGPGQGSSRAVILRNP